MQIYILRHGEAELREARKADAVRALTAKGKSDVRRVLSAAREAKLAPDYVFSSPLLRASQTAAVAVKLFGVRNVVETKSLLPSASPQAIWKELDELRDAEQVLLAGHEPHLSHLIRFLLEAPVVVDLKKGTLVRIDSTGRQGPPRGVLKWMLTPRLVRGR
jgi:phosphohistidine phosphatase